MHRFRHLVFAGLGLLALLLLWQLAFALGGPFVMPAPIDAFSRAADLIYTGAVWQPASLTVQHVLIGFAIGSACGLGLGLLGGSVPDLGTSFDAISTVVLGVPPIIWIVLALLWFGPRGVVPTFTVAIGIAPIVFAGALRGSRPVHPELDELAAAFRAPWTQSFLEIRLPQMAIALVPAFSTALGLSWKMALMAEVIEAVGGIGGKIADARANLDTTDTMAWVVIALALLLATDLLMRRRWFAHAAGTDET